MQVECCKILSIALNIACNANIFLKSKRVFVIEKKRMNIWSNGMKGGEKVCIFIQKRSVLFNIKYCRIVQQCHAM
jgi:hypothetical protein